MTEIRHEFIILRALNQMTPSGEVERDEDSICKYLLQRYSIQYQETLEDLQSLVHNKIISKSRNDGQTFYKRIKDIVRFKRIVKPNQENNELTILVFDNPTIHENLAKIQTSENTPFTSLPSSVGKGIKKAKKVYDLSKNETITHRNQAKFNKADSEIASTLDLSPNACGENSMLNNSLTLMNFENSETFSSSENIPSTSTPFDVGKRLKKTKKVYDLSKNETIIHRNQAKFNKANSEIVTTLASSLNASDENKREHVLDLNEYFTPIKQAKFNQADSENATTLALSPNASGEYVKSNNSPSHWDFENSANMDVIEVKKCEHTPSTSSRSKARERIKKGKKVLDFLYEDKNITPKIEVTFNEPNVEEIVLGARERTKKVKKMLDLSEFENITPVKQAKLDENAMSNYSPSIIELENTQNNAISNIIAKLDEIKVISPGKTRSKSSPSSVGKGIKKATKVLDLSINENISPRKQAKLNENAMSNYSPSIIEFENTQNNAISNIIAKLDEIKVISPEKTRSKSSPSSVGKGIKKATKMLDLSIINENITTRKQERIKMETWENIPSTNSPSSGLKKAKKVYDLSQNENIIPIKHVRFNEANNKIRGALPPNNEPLVIETAKPANNEIKEITAKIDEIKIDLPENTFSPSSSSIRTGIKKVKTVYDLTKDEEI